jgi:RNA polymerase sigma-70 factor (ECF subfamily)
MRQRRRRPSVTLVTLGVLARYPWMTDVDRQALALLARRDPRGIDLAYTAHAARLHGFLRRLSGKSDVADDLLQHAFLKLAERGPELRPDSNLRAWLFAVARNAYVGRVRAALDDDEPALEALASPSHDVEARLLLGDVELALAALRVDDRELLLLVGVEGVAPTDVARILGLEPAAVRQRLARARSRLLAELERQPGATARSRRTIP